jgi:hypothetical protein
MAPPVEQGAEKSASGSDLTIEGIASIHAQPESVT